jgi:lipoprotein NlpD
VVYLRSLLYVPSMLILNRQTVSFLLVALMLCACATKTPAPVIDRRAPASPAPVQPANPATASASSPATTIAKPADQGKTHTIQKGETLYSIAFQNNVDYRELAMWNNIENLNLIKVGDVLRLSPPTIAGTSPATPPSAAIKPGEVIVTPLVVNPQPSAANERPAGNSAQLKTEPRGGKVPFTDQALARLNTESAAPSATATPPVVAPVLAPPPATPNVPAVAAPAAPTAPANAGAVDWAWPVKGKVITMFTEQNKGIDIAGSKGAAVNAAAAGTVIHTGAGIRGYGRLVIIKHGTGWVSAYAHNDKIVVMEGQEVKRGQKVAEMGNSDADQVKLHFEIRRQGKPVDPLSLLPKP